MRKVIGLTNVVRSAFSSSDKPLAKTVLCEYHRDKLSAKMVEFAGYEMPVQYKEGVLKEHLHCRESASLFDVSHMGQVKIYGKDAVDFIEKLTVGDIRGRKPHEGYLSLILNKQAGIIDDTIITKMEDHIHMVVNGGNKYIDLEHMKNVKAEFFAKADLAIEYLDTRQLLAIQGPRAAEVLQSLTETDLSKVLFMQHIDVTLKNGMKVNLSRCGYTGEDGFEISVSAGETIALADLLLANPLCKPAGLGARDSLRVEAGLCLHGQDMSDTVSPAEATLLWTVRKIKDNLHPEKVKFLGSEVLAKQRKEGASRKRVGFMVKNSGILRLGCDVLNAEGEKVGHVSSGTYSPILKKGVGMIFVPPTLAAIGQELKVVSKGKEFPIEVTKMPFVEARYFRG